MKIFSSISFCIFLLSGVQAFSQTKAASGAPANAPQQTKSNVTQSTKQPDGQLVFEQNCSRCHNAPEGFSSRISGTVARHMRVRAGLSSEDEKAILRFLNP